MAERERWKAMVLRSMLRPAWLNANAPENDVAISSRCRYARNLRGHHFPNHASSAELKTIAARVKEAGASLGLETFRRLVYRYVDFIVGLVFFSTVLLSVVAV